MANNQNARLYERKAIQSQRKFHLEKKKFYTCVNAEAIHIPLSLPFVQSSLIRESLRYHMKLEYTEKMFFQML
jgi:deoxycytidine triphosphate deaminase